LSIPSFILIFIAAAIGSGVNSVAGGGTLVTFPAIVWLGLSPLVANATSTVALWPGAVGSMWAYRGELTGARRWLTWFTIPSLAGGAFGAWLLLHTSAHRFDDIVPFLVLGATVLFVVQRPLTRWLAPGRSEFGAEGQPLPRPAAWVLAAQFAVGVYGGYFGAGIGILMLATLGAMGLTGIHRMNGLKNWGAMCMNGIAAVAFAASGLVVWPVAIAMTAGALAGGYVGARLALRAGQVWVRRAVILTGLIAFIWLLAR